MKSIILLIFEMGFGLMSFLFLIALFFGIIKKVEFSYIRLIGGCLLFLFLNRLTYVINKEEE